MIAPILPAGIAPILHGTFMLKTELEGVQAATTDWMRLQDADAGIPEEPAVGIVDRRG